MVFCLISHRSRQRASHSLAMFATNLCAALPRNKNVCRASSPQKVCHPSSPQKCLARTICVTLARRKKCVPHYMQQIHESAPAALRPSRLSRCACRAAHRARRAEPAETAFLDAFLDNKQQTKNKCKQQKKQKRKNEPRKQGNKEVTAWRGNAFQDRV